MALPRAFGHMLESNQDEVVDRYVAGADLPPGIFVRVHRGPRLLLGEKNW